MILGIYHPAEGVGHDTGVALLTEDGRILAAQSEERFSRVKMDGGFPLRAIEALRRIARFTAADLSCVAVPFMSAKDKTREGLHLMLSSLKNPTMGLRQVQKRLDENQFQKGMASIGAYRHVEEYQTNLREVHARDGRPALAEIGRASCRERVYVLV